MERRVGWTAAVALSHGALGVSVLWACYAVGASRAPIEGAGQRFASNIELLAGSTLTSVIAELLWFAVVVRTPTARELQSRVGLVAIPLVSIPLAFVALFVCVTTAPDPIWWVGALAGTGWPAAVAGWVTRSGARRRTPSSGADF